MDQLKLNASLKNTTEELKLDGMNERKLFRTIIDNIPVCVYAKDKYYRKTLVNAYELLQFGWADESEVLGKTDADLFGEEVGVNTLVEDRQVIEDGLTILNEEKQLANGMWAMISKLPLRDENDQITGMVGISVNVTERVKSENKLRTSIIEQKLLLESLEQARRNAEKSAKAKESFLTNMSHEIRTPLNVIIGMIREIGKGQLSDSQKTYLKHSEASAYHLLSIINNVLDMSKIEAGEFKLDIKDFSLSAVLSNVNSILSSRASGKKIAFTVETTGVIKRALKGDSLRLSQVLINLLGNSIKFTDEGFVKLNVTLINETDELQHLRFEIIDSGIGMSEEFQNNMFNKFTQENDHSNRSHEGTGLGMSISKEIIEMMGGSIDLKSKKGLGTEIAFDIEFNIGIEENLIRIDKTTRNFDISGTKVLIVEDNEMNRFIARQSLIQAKCVIDEAENGIQAVEKVKNTNYDIILMDIQMPVMDGMEATKIIRNEMKIETPIIALTANAFKHDIDLYMSNGMNDFLIKPYKEEELFSKIENNCRLFKNRNNTNLNGSESSNTSIANNKLFSLRQLNVIANGDERFIETMLIMFKNIVNNTIEQLKNAFEENDIDRIKKVSHKIKPSLDNLEVSVLYNEIRALENFNTLTGCPETLKTLINYVTEMLLKISVEIEQSGLIKIKQTV